ncbi:acetyl-CoA acetyltransferase PhaA [Chlorogloeopsis fritschii PCC 9212]|uniref:acetyl-CoA C-acetyltransferase n=1 Tax=Chlorogloeopsis fritschii PCC 6912 TaxID=211165 RepID=A0A3S0XLQ7_CHLFR|nr:acetyl-CoA acetyltransferase PhaA [Chlorogloeopsis fritschii]RUR72880.1 acetyl-CoA acetyltransferase [Chlorogloeopsis fritschii PCC 6912]
MRDVYIVSAVRTPLGRFGGVLADFSPTDLGAHAMRSALERAGITGEALDLYIMGNVLRAGHGQLLPRQAAFKAGIPEAVNGYSVDMVCSSGMMSVINATLAIRAGEADIVLAGGMESMSQTGFFLSHRARWGYKFLLGAPEQLTDLLLRDGLMDATRGEGMGEQTERIAEYYGFSRKDLDEIAVDSHWRAAAATERGSFKNEIASIEVTTKKGTQIIDTDEGIRPDTSLETLTKLRPAFNKNGVLTAGNSSQISDGAAALILASQAAVDKYGLKPVAKVLGGSWEGGESWRFVEMPVGAAKKLLDKLNRKVSDFDLFENNEAFALNSLLFHRMLGVPIDKLNVNGGAIALGHPIGASGARIIVTLINALQERQQSLGMAALCHGTGGGTAIAIEQI